MKYKPGIPLTHGANPLGVSPQKEFGASVLTDRAVGLEATVYPEQKFLGGRLALASNVRKDLTVVNPQWAELFLPYNVKTMKFGFSLCPFPLAGVEDYCSVCPLWLPVPGLCPYCGLEITLARLLQEHSVQKLDAILFPVRYQSLGKGFHSPGTEPGV